MTTRLSRRAALAVGLSIIAIMLVWAPMAAFADSTNSKAPEDAGASATAPGHTDVADPGNSDSAPGQEAKSDSTTATITTTAADPGKSEDSPGHTKTDDTTSATDSKDNGSDKKTSTTSSGGSGNNVPASNLDDGVGGGVGNSENQDKDRPAGASNGPGTGQQPATSCPNDKKGGDDTGHGANQGTVYDSTCDGRVSENGQGGGNASGRPCMGCVGNADDKNPGVNSGNGQYPGPKNDRSNRGYECDDNNGVGKGNPAHTGCAPTTPQFDCAGHLLPNNHSASECDTPQFDCAGHQLPNNHSASECDTPQFDCAGHQLPNNHSASECDTPRFDCAGHQLPNNHSASECSPPNSEFDCAGHLLPNDHPVTECTTTEEPPEVLPTTLCPDGTVMPASGECDESVLPDFVLGIRLNRDPVAPAVLPSTLQAPEEVQGAVLPFTGSANLLPFVMVSLAMVTVGGTTLVRRKK